MDRGMEEKVEKGPEEQIYKMCLTAETSHTRFAREAESTHTLHRRGGSGKGYGPSQTGTENNQGAVKKDTGVFG